MWFEGILWLGFLGILFFQVGFLGIDCATLLLWNWGLKTGFVSSIDFGYEWLEINFSHLVRTKKILAIFFFLALTALPMQNLHFKIFRIREKPPLFTRFVVWEMRVNGHTYTWQETRVGTGQRLFIVYFFKFQFSSLLPDLPCIVSYVCVGVRI